MEVSPLGRDVFTIVVSGSTRPESALGNLGRRKVERGIPIPIHSAGIACDPRLPHQVQHWLSYL
jgi:hypothetical protein